MNPTIIRCMPLLEAAERGFSWAANSKEIITTALLSMVPTFEGRYALLVGNIREVLEEAKCRLLERAAGLVADVCLDDPRVERVTVSVRKFGSVPGLGSAEVKLTRPE